MQDKTSIFDPLVSPLSAELPSVIHAVESLPSVVDVALLIISALLAGSFYYVLKNRKGNFAFKKWLEKNFDFSSLMIALGMLLLISLLSLLHKPVLFYFSDRPLILAALLGFPILIRRLSVMQEQVEKSQQQIEVGQKQIEVGQKQARAMQYNAANELLWSDSLGSRLAGIQALWHFAKTYPEEEYHTVMNVFSQFIRYPVPYAKNENKGNRRDIAAILHHMGKKTMAGAKPYKIDLRMSLLGNASWRGAHLEEAILNGANLEEADLSESHLSCSQLVAAKLRGTDFRGADLTLAFINATDFTNARNLTQEQINACVFIKDSIAFNERPKLPEGFTCREMTNEEWVKAIMSYAYQRHE